MHHIPALRVHTVHVFVYSETENFYHSLTFSQTQLFQLKIVKLMRGKKTKDNRK